MVHQGFFQYIPIYKVDTVLNQNEMVEITHVLKSEFESRFHHLLVGRLRQVIEPL